MNNYSHIKNIYIYVSHCAESVCLCSNGNVFYSNKINANRILLNMSCTPTGKKLLIQHIMLACTDLDENYENCKARTVISQLNGLFHFLYRLSLWLFLDFKVNGECTCNDCMVFRVKLMLSCLHACLMIRMKSL